MLTWLHSEKLSTTRLWPSRRLRTRRDVIRFYIFTFLHIYVCMGFSADKSQQLGLVWWCVWMIRWCFRGTELKLWPSGKHRLRNSIENENCSLTSKLDLRGDNLQLSIKVTKPSETKTLQCCDSLSTCSDSWSERTHAVYIMQWSVHTCVGADKDDESHTFLRLCISSVDVIDATRICDIGC